jgi:hypothetical protein
MLRNKLTKKRAALVAVFTLALAGTAFAFWSAGGSGSGSGSVANPGAQNVTVNQTSTVSNLVPGGPAGSLSGDFTNGNTNAVKVTSVSITGHTVDATHLAAGCTADNFETGGTITVPNGDVAASSTGGSWTGGTVALKNTSSNQDACKGATVTVSYSAS